MEVKIAFLKMDEVIWDALFVTGIEPKRIPVKNHQVGSETEITYLLCSRVEVEGYLYRLELVPEENDPALVQAVYVQPAHILTVADLRNYDKARPLGFLPKQ